MGRPAGPAFAVEAAAGAFGFALFLAKAPDVETAKIARLTTNIFFILKLPDGKDCAVEDNPSTARVFLHRQIAKTAPRPFPSKTRNFL
jgi:hypothetical protein